MSPRDVHSVNEVQRIPEIDLQHLQPQFVTFSAQRYDPLQTPSTIKIKSRSRHNVHGTSCIKTPLVPTHPPRRETVISSRATYASKDTKFKGTTWVRRFHDLPQSLARRVIAMKRVFLEDLALVYAKMNHSHTRSPVVPRQQSVTLHERFTIELVTTTRDGKPDNEEEDMGEACTFLSYVRLK